MIKIVTENGRVRYGTERHGKGDKFGYTTVLLIENIIFCFLFYSSFIYNRKMCIKYCLLEWLFSKIKNGGTILFATDDGFAAADNLLSVNILKQEFVPLTFTSNHLLQIGNAS